MQFSGGPSTFVGALSTGNGYVFYTTVANFYRRNSNGSNVTLLFTPSGGSVTHSVYDSSSLKNYEFDDKNLSAGTYLYRLKQIDCDGSFEYSKEIEIEVSETPMEFYLSPQPCQSLLRKY